MSTLRIALDATPLTAPYTGICRYTAELARRMALARPEAEIVLLSDQKYEPISGLPNLRCDPRPARALEKRWWSVGLPLRLRKMKASLFHGTDFAVPLTGSTPAVVTIHDLAPFRAAEWRMPATAERKARRLPRAVARAKVILTPSECVRQEVIDQLGVPEDKVRVTPLASSLHQVPGRSSSPYILYAGPIEPRKNLVRLLRAFARLRGPERLVLAGGGGWGRDEVKAAVASLRLEARVTLTGAVLDDELAKLYSHCAVFVYVPLYEGFGLPVVEAMSCGAKVVTSRDTACAETAGDAALLVNPEDETEIASAIEAALKNDDLRRNSMARSLQFSWAHTADLTWQAYEIALSRS